MTNDSLRYTICFSTPYSSGQQPDNARITVEETVIESRDNTVEEIKWVQSTLTVEGVKRTDDGLYECLAENEAGRLSQSGHITVEFPPTFEDQLHDKQWSWDQRPIELTCLATAISNATVTWWY